MIPAHVAAWALKRDKKNKKGKEQEELSAMAYGGNKWEFPRTGGYDRGNNDYNPSGKTYQSKGGGTPKVPSAQEDAQATLWLEQERDKIADQNAVDAATKAANDRAALVTKAQPIQESAYNTAKNYGATAANSRGYQQDLLDKYGVLAAYYNDINTQKGGIEDIDTTPTYNTETAFQNAADVGQGTYRGDTTRSINTLTPTGWEETYVPNTSDDAILASILGGQNTEAMGQVESAYKRGLLNPTGYESAIKGVETANTAGNASLQSLGGGVLGGYRNELTTQKNNALNTAAGLTLADRFDLDAFTKALGTTTTENLAGMEGDIYGVVGDQRFFDPTKIIGLAGAKQGYYNPVTQTGAEAGGAVSPLLEQMTEEAKRKSTTQQTAF